MNATVRASGAGGTHFIVSKVDLPGMEGRSSKHGRSCFDAMKCDLHHVEGCHGSRSLATCETSTSALPRIAVCPSMLVMVTLQMMMPTGHLLEPRSSKHGRSTRHWMMGRPPRMEGHPSTLGRSLVETMNTTLLCLEARAARQVGSGRIVSVAGMDTLGPQTGSFPGGLHRMPGGHRSLVARTARARLHGNEGSMPADQGWRATREASKPCRSTTQSPVIDASK